MGMMLARVLLASGLVLAAIGLVVSINSWRFRRRVAREAVEMWGRRGAPRSLVAACELPPPVTRYRARALGTRTVAVRAARLRHGGTFRPRLDGGWLPIRGEEHFAADPPGFVWWGRARVAPGLWVEARDRSVRGAGGMLVSVESTVTLADRTGPDMDQGALLRLLAELPWLPTALFDDRYVGWTAIDDRRAEARLRVGPVEVAGVFEFGDTCLIVGFTAYRPRDDSGGQAVLASWSGRYGDYRVVDGLTVPCEVVVSWKEDGQDLPYARFQIERIEFDPAAPY